MNKQYINTDNKWFCKLCDYNSKTRQSITSHIWRKHTEKGLLHKGGSHKGHISWNIGLTKETDERVRKNSENLSKTLQIKIKNGTYIPSRMCKEKRDELSIKMSLNNRGGKCKWFTVAGQKVQGTWERDIALICEKEKIEWYKPKNNRDVWVYTINGKKKLYTPDFYFKKYDCYFEVKGYWWGNDKEKMKCIYEQYPERKLYLVMKKEYNDIIKNGIKKYLDKT